MSITQKHGDGPFACFIFQPALHMPGAKIYDLDETPASIKKWTDLENVRIYRDFFKERDGEF